MATAEELIVAIRSEGVSDTRQDLEGIEDAMEQTAESAGDSAEQLEGFTQRFQGALSAAVAGLTIGVGALVSTIPVVGEIMSGLFAIFEAFGFQIDQLARQLGAGGLTNAFFMAAEAIFELDGALGDIAAVIGIFLTAALSAAAAVAAWAVKTMGFVAAAKALGSVLLTAAGSVATFVAGLGAIGAALAVALAALAAFVVAYALDLGNVRDTTDRILGQVWGFFVALASDLKSWAGGLASDAFAWGTDAIGRLLAGVTSGASALWEWFTGLASGLASWASDLASDAFEWGTNIVQNIIDGIKALIGRLKDKLADLQNIAPSVNVQLPDIGGGGSVNGTSTTSGGGGIAGTAQRIFSGSGGGGGSTVLDGRQLTESTGRYRTDPNRRRGL